MKKAVGIMTSPFLACGYFEKVGRDYEWPTFCSCSEVEVGKSAVYAGFLALGLKMLVGILKRLVGILIGPGNVGRYFEKACRYFDRA